MDEFHEFFKVFVLVNEMVDIEKTQLTAEAQRALRNIPKTLRPLR
jgi:hypothetical protein